MICRCGHGRHTHRATANAISKRRRRGDRRPARAACQAVRWVSTSSLTDRPTTAARQAERCRCRDWHPAVPA